eukprot:TRINITY_DN22092_c0_g1_i1.p1 TRINITY_DN22092_c0_g1~~TRINITY_DN22092_c0_g1_i1.p1  ORF type:complete len:971 (+),score=160.82 TRINITY_DN22092_c0_g1_i1:116-3028(+)
MASDAEGHDALREVSAPDGAWNWALVGPHPEELPLIGGGSGSIEEMRDCLATQGNCTFYGLLRLTFGTGRLARIKFVFVHGSNVDSDFATKRGSLSPVLSASEEPAEYCESEEPPAARRIRGRSSTLKRMVERGQAMGQRPAMEKAISHFAHCVASIEVTQPEDLELDAFIERVQKVSTVDSANITVDSFKEAQNHAKAERERKTGEEEAQRERTDAERKVRDAERKTREELERRLQEEELDRKTNEEAERRRREEAELQAKKQADCQAREAAECKAREEAERLAREEERKAREELELLAKEEERKVREEAERKARQQAEQEARETERRAREEAERKAREAVIKAKEEAEQLARDAERRVREEAAEVALLQALSSCDLEEIARCISEAEALGLPVEEAKLSMRSEVRRQSLEKELSAALAAQADAQVLLLLRRAQALGMERRPGPVRDAELVMAKLQRHTVEVEFRENVVRGCSWLPDPIIWIRASKGVEVSIAFEDLGGEPKFGFHLLSNRPSIPRSCHDIFPGGPVLAQANCGTDRTATAKLLAPADSPIFCVPSLVHRVADGGGRARIDVLCSKEIEVCKLPEPRWPFETVVSWEWSLAEKSAGGPRGKASWLHNPQLRIYLEDDGPVCVYACLQSLVADTRTAVSMHAVRNKRSMSYNAHAAVVPHNHEIIASPEHSYQDDSVSICFELSRTSLILDKKESLAPPFYLIPSMASERQEGSFEVHIASTGALRCERVSALHLGVPASPSSVRARSQGHGKSMLSSPTKTTFPEMPETWKMRPVERRESKPVVRARSVSVSESKPVVRARSISVSESKLARQQPGDSSPPSELRRRQRLQDDSATATAPTQGYPNPDTQPAKHLDSTTSTTNHGCAPTPNTQPARHLPSLGARVRVSERCTPGAGPQLGTVRFTGETAFSPGLWVGVALDNPLGRNDGTVLGKYYFECDASYGLFVRPAALLPAPEPA